MTKTRDANMNKEKVLLHGYVIYYKLYMCVCAHLCMLIFMDLHLFPRVDCNLCQLMYIF